MVRVTTASDVELQVLLLTDEGKRKLADGEELTPDDSMFKPEDTTTHVKVYLKIDKTNGEPFVAEFISLTPTETNCYVESHNGIDTLVVTIPSDTFSVGGRLMISIATNSPNENFVDKEKLTVTEYEKTEVFYVMQ